MSIFAVVTNLRPETVAALARRGGGPPARLLSSHRPDRETERLAGP